MADPFLEHEDGSLLEKEVKRLRLENRELRLNNTNLRARLALASPTGSVDGAAHRPQPAGAGADRAVTNSEADQQPEEAKISASASVRSGADITSMPSGNAAGATLTDVTAEQQSRSRRARGTSSSSATGSSPQISAARIQEAVQRVKKELQGELETRHKAAALERAEKEQLKREFERFVSTTCEREAAYQLVYMQLYREMEQQKELVRCAQAQLEEQRLQSVDMRKTLEAAVAAAKNSDSGVAPQSASSPVAVPISSAALGTAGDDATVSVAKQKRTKAEAATVQTPLQQTRRLPRNLCWSDVAGVPPAAASDGLTQEAETASETDSSVTGSTGPRQLKIIAGGAALRNTRKAQYTKRARDAVSATSSRGSLRNAIVGFGVPVAPVFANEPTKAAPTDRSSTGGPSNSGKHSDARAPSAAVAPSPCSSSSVNGPASEAMEALWRLLAQHTEATQGFLPLWQHLAALRGSDRHTVLQVLTSLLVHLLSPDVPSASSTGQMSQSTSFASLPRSFTSQGTSITVVATAIRLLAVQLEDAAQQQRGHAESQQHTRMLLNSLFYRVCVATLCRWQVVDSSFEALEHWATAVHHLYGFQPVFLQLMHYTNTAAAYHRTRIAHSWISYTAQCIFSQCFTASASALPAETAVARWRELCDSVGWSTHAQPLERIETAAARCVAMTRVGHGPLTAACAEEALLSLRLIVLYKGFDHMEQIAKLLEQPGVLPMAITKEVYAELVSLAVRDRVPFRTQDALHHALRLLREYLQEVAPERCTSAEHFVSAPRRSHVLAALALLRVDATASAKEAAASLPSPASGVGTQGYAVTVSSEVREAGREAALQWLQAQKVALEMVRQSPALAPDRPLLLRDTALGRTLLRDAETG